MHHDFEADLTPKSVTLYFPQEHGDGPDGPISNDWGFTCEHSPKTVVQSCDQCGATMTAAFNQAGPEGPRHHLRMHYHLTYDLSVGVYIGNRNHKCDPARNPACRQAARER